VHGVVGLPGSGKSYKLTEGVLWSIKKAQRRERKHGKPIRVVANFEVGQRVFSHVLQRSQLRDHGWPVAGETVVPCYSGKRCKAKRHVRAFWPDKRVQVFSKLSELVALRAPIDRWTREPLEELHVYADEAHLMASARFWQETGQQVLAYFSQVRKAGVFLVWSSQHPSNVETGLRRVTTAATKCSSVVVPVVGRVLITTRYLFTLMDDDEERKHALWWTLRVRRFRIEIAEAFETYAVLSMENDVRRERSEAPARRRGAA
jgi:hypothetical protein